MRGRPGWDRLHSAAVRTAKAGHTSRWLICSCSLRVVCVKVWSDRSCFRWGDAALLWVGRMQQCADVFQLPVTKVLNLLCTKRVHDYGCELLDVHNDDVNARISSTLFYIVCCKCRSVCKILQMRKAKDINSFLVSWRVFFVQKKSFFCQTPLQLSVHLIVIKWLVILIYVKPSISPFTYKLSS